MLTLPIYMRNSTFYLHTRVQGKQFKRSLHTNSKQIAIIRASQLLEQLSVMAQFPFDPNKLKNYEIDLAKGVIKADSPEDHQRAIEAIGLLSKFNLSTPSSRVVLEEEPQGLTLLEVLDKWLTMKKYAEATVQAYKNTVEEFAVFFGKQKSITLVGKGDITRWQEKLLTLGNTHRTVDNKVNTLRALFYFAKKQGYFFAENPAANRDLLTQKDRTKAQFEIFEAGEISSFYSSELFQNEKKKDTDYYWVCVIALVSGCRISEITSLKKRQLKLTDAGNPFIRISDSKTLAGVRDVPLPMALHTELEKLASDKKDDEQLFRYTMRLGKGSGNAVGQKFGRQLEKVGITRPKLVFHSIRKYTNDFLLKHDIPLEVRCQVVGHEVDNVNVKTYSRQFTVDELHGLIGEIQIKLFKTATLNKN